MNRTGLLAAVAVMLASSPSFAQFGGMGGGMGGGGGWGVWAAAWAAKAVPGMMMQGGRFAGAGFRGPTIRPGRNGGRPAPQRQDRPQARHR